MKYVGTMIAAYRPLTALFISHNGAAWGRDGSKIYPKMFKMYTFSIFPQGRVTISNYIFNISTNTTSESAFTTSVFPITCRVFYNHVYTAVYLELITDIPFHNYSPPFCA